MGVNQLTVEAIHLLSGIENLSFVPATDDCLKRIQLFGPFETGIPKSLKEIALRRRNCFDRGPAGLFVEKKALAKGGAPCP